MGQVQDKVVMITGAAGGIAEGIVRRFAEEGAKLVLVDSTEERLQKRVEEMKGVLGEYITAVGDLGKPEEVDAIIAKASEKDSNYTYYRSTIDFALQTGWDEFLAAYASR